MSELPPNSPGSGPDETALRERHEPTDIDIRSVLKSGVILFVILGLSLYLLVWVFDRYTADARRLDPRLSPLAAREQRPPEPRLLATPNLEYQHLRTAQEEELRTDGWIDEAQKIKRISISRAMDLLVERGLPQTEPRQLDGEAPGKEEAPGKDDGAAEQPAATDEDDAPRDKRRKPDLPEAEASPTEEPDEPARGRERTPRRRESRSSREERDTSSPPADRETPE